MDAEVDRMIPTSILSLPILTRLQVEHEPCEETQIQGTMDQHHVAIGRVELEWAKECRSQGFQGSGQQIPPNRVKTKNSRYEMKPRREGSIDPSKLIVNSQM